MHTENLSHWIHDHSFNAASGSAEKSTRTVVWITAVMMIVEITAGYGFNSMALLADGWHMSSHTLAIGLSALAYAASRRYANDRRFAFGTWKIEILGGFASAILLLGIALLMVVGSLERIASPQPIQFREAIVVAVLGLGVNITCALVLGKAHHDHGTHVHDGERNHDGQSHQHHHDLNLKSAYIHVLADAATSVLAILALTGGWIFGWTWLDPLMGIAGACLVAAWSKGLIADTSKILLDREMDHPIVQEIREAIETDITNGHPRVTDLHVWRVGKNAYSCALAIISHSPSLDADAVRERLACHAEIVHSTIEIHLCPGDPRLDAA
jgi:cation diffusion facilitator family transporter